MNNHSPASFDLSARAWQALRDAGFEPDFSPQSQQQLQALMQHLPTHEPLPEVRDLRKLRWSSIDNTESRDLDQVEVAEQQPNGDIRVFVGIADVDAYVTEETPIDRHAETNTTTIYAGVAIFPMLPERLSTDLTSLLEDGDRLAVVVEMDIQPDGTIRRSDLYRALLRNHAKLAYNAVGDWLEGKAPPPDDVQRLPDLEAQIRLQLEAAHRLHAARQRAGLLDFETIEARPVVQEGQVTDLDVPHKNEARCLIEDFMIAANTVTASYLEQKGRVTVQRVVRAPERWERIVVLAAQYGAHLPSLPDSRALAAFLAERKAADPDHFPDLSLSIIKLLGPGEYAVVRSKEDPPGHFGLAVQNYTHSTAPNRRFADLITQRLLKAALADAPAPYTEEQLALIALRCTERENAARKVERLMRKIAAALLFRKYVGTVFDAIVTGATAKGTYVRVLSPPVEGRVVRGEEQMDVGDRVRVRLVHTDVERGFIDFERA